MQIHKVSVQIDETIRENSTLKRMCENREAEIASLMASNREIEKNNEEQQEQNKTLSITVNFCSYLVKTIERIKSKKLKLM